MDKPASATIGVCANCLSNDFLQPNESVLHVKTGTVKIRNSLTQIYGLKFPFQENQDNELLILCPNCTEILVQLHYFFCCFRNLCSNDSCIGKAHLETSNVKESGILKYSQGISICRSQDDLNVDISDDNDNTSNGTTTKMRLKRMRLRSQRANTVKIELPTEMKEEPISSDSDGASVRDNADVDWVYPDSTHFDILQPKVQMRVGRGRSYRVNRTTYVATKIKRRGRGRTKALITSRQISSGEVKRMRGRPKKIFNNTSDSMAEVKTEETAVTIMKKRGRPKKVKTSDDIDQFNNMENDEPIHVDDEMKMVKEKRPRGRPRGSKNYGNLMQKLCSDNSKVHVCPHCGKQAKSNWNLHLHIRGVHDGLRPYPCPICKKQFAGNDGLKNHLRVTHGDRDSNEIRMFVCKEVGCGKTFAYRAGLRNHGVIHNSTMKKFACPVCGMRHRSNHDMQRHMAVHSQEKPVICEQCGTSVKTKSNLAQHRRFMHPETFGGPTPESLTCHICNKTFKTPGNMKQHIRSVHDQVRPYRCPHCRKEFSCTSNLKVHVRGVHKEEYNLQRTEPHETGQQQGLAISEQHEDEPEPVNLIQLEKPLFRPTSPEVEPSGISTYLPPHSFMPFSNFLS